MTRLAAVSSSRVIRSLKPWSRSLNRVHSSLWSSSDDHDVRRDDCLWGVMLIKHMWKALHSDSCHGTGVFGQCHVFLFLFCLKADTEVQMFSSHWVHHMRTAISGKCPKPIVRTASWLHVWKKACIWGTLSKSKGKGLWQHLIQSRDKIQEK